MDFAFAQPIPRRSDGTAADSGRSITAGMTSGTDIAAFSLGRMPLALAAGGLDLPREGTYRMRSRLLVSVAVLAAGLAVASAQNAPGGGQERTRSQHHRSPAAAPRK